MTNIKSTKRALLMSVLSMFLCVVMLAGTTFAWFTDSVTSTNNIIKSGNLNVEMYYADGKLAVPADDSTDWKNANGVAIYTADQLWEPGYTDAKHIKISNEGNLALKYQLAIIPTGVVSDLAEVIDVYLYEIADTDANATQVATRADLNEAMKVGTLKDVISQGIVQGNLNAQADYTTTIVLKMQESAGNDYMDKSIGDSFTIQLLATQYTAESDSFDNTYDADAWVDGMQVYNASDLQAAINAGETDLKLMDDIVLDESIVIPASATTFSMRSVTPAIVIDLNGKNITIEATYDDANYLASSAIVNNGNLILTGEGSVKATNNYTVRNYGTMVIDGITVENGIMNFSDLTVESGNISNSRSGKHAIYSNNAKLTINGGTFYNGNPGNATIFSYAGEVEINGGEFSIADGTATLGWTSCLLDAQGNAKFTINGGIINGEIRDYNKNTTIKGGIFNHNSVNSFIADGFKAVENNGVYYVVSDSIDNVVTSVEQLQKALDEATGDAMIVIAADITGDVIVNQKEGVNITIDGANYDYDGVISIYGHARHTGAETLTIKNIDFVTNSDVELRYYIDSNWTDEARRYAHNVTIDNCTFTNNGNGTVVPTRFRQAYNITMKDCEVYNTFSPFWCTGVQGLTIDTVTANCANEGITAASSNNVLIENCTITVPGENSFGIRTDATDGYKLTVNNCTLNVAKPIVIRGSSETYTVIVDGGKYVSTTEELINAIKNAPVGETTTIVMADGVYAGDIKITVAALGKSGGDVVIKPIKGAKPVITGTVTLGYRNQGVGATMYNANVTFEGITFDHAAVAHSLDIQDVKSLTLKNCTVIGESEHGIVCARGNATGTSKIIECTFENAGLQLLGNYATGLVIDNCDFNDSCVNVQAGNGVTIQNCTFNNTLTAANVDDSFYAIRSNSTPITVKDCELNIDSELTSVVTTAQAKWYLLANRGTTNWTVENVEVNMTDAAVAQTQLKVTACTSTGLINTTNLTVNGVAQ